MTRAFTPHLKKFVIPLLVITLCTICLWSSFCGTSDITDDPSKNGGYNRGAIFLLQTPIAVYKHYAHPLPLSITNAADTEIARGSRLQIVRVRSLFGLFAVAADNLPRMSAEARFLDGPLAGTTVDITAISAHTGHRDIKLDPIYLQTLAPTSMPSSNPIALPAAMEMIRSLPETKSFQAILASNNRSLAIILEPPAGDQLQFATFEESDFREVWNHFRISPSGEITVRQPVDDSWMDLQTWRRTYPDPPFRPERP